MFYSNDPVKDWDNYCDYLEKKDNEWHEENDEIIEGKIEELECLIEDLKLCKSNKEVEQTFKDYNKEIEYELDENVLNTIKNETKEILNQIKNLKKELER